MEIEEIQQIYKYRNIESWIIFSNILYNVVIVIRFEKEC